jgi:ABC-type branched-subunit amino acid transport system substrate-binding protein
MRMSWLRTVALVGVLALGIAACPADDPPPVDDDVDDVEPAPTDEALRLGYILPETGPLAFLGPAQINPIEMAIQEANDAGGVLGNPVELLSGDEAGDAAVASETADSHLAQGVHAILGAAASGMSLAIIDQIVGEGVVMCSASNTSPAFTDYDDNGYYFRTAPSDLMQGVALAEILLEDGHLSLAILARADDYGIGLLDATVAEFEEAGGEVVYQDSYDPDATAFSAEVSEMIGAAPDAIAIIPFDEGIQILQELIEQGWDMNNTFGADGIRSTGLNASVDPDDPNVVDGFKGTNPDPQTDEDFIQRLEEFAPELDELTFAPQAYDCANWVMLAAEAAGSVDGTAIRDHMFEVLQGDNQCRSFPECAEFLRDGQTIAYQFASGTTEMSDVGEPAGAFYEVWAWEDGSLTTLESREFFAD